MRRVVEQFIAAEIFGEQVFTPCDALADRHFAEAQRLPGIFGHLDNKSAGVVIEAVGMGPYPALFGLDEDEGEGIELVMGAEPDKAVLALIHAGLKFIRIGLAHPAVEAVSGNDKVVPEIRLKALDLGLKCYRYAECGSAALQNIQHAAPRDAAKPVPARGDGGALEMHIDIIPMGKAIENFLRRFGIVIAQILDRRVGEHHAPAERVVMRVALDHMDIMPRIAQFHRYGKIKPGSPAADTGYFHGHDLSCKTPARKNLFYA